MSFTKHLNGLSDDLLKAAHDLLEGKKEEKDEIEFEIPEEVAKEDVGDFVVAASAAKKAGKKEFEFGGKKFPVTIKKAVATEEVAEEFKTCSGCKTEEKCMAESKCMGKSESEEGKKKNEIEINPTLEEEVQLDELNKNDIAKAIEIAMDNEGAMTKAVKMIEKIKKGLSKHKDVQAALRLANEEKIAEESLEEAPKISTGKSKGTIVANGIRGKGMKKYDVTAVVNKSGKFEFKITDEAGKFQTVDIKQAARMLGEETEVEEVESLEEAPTEKKLIDYLVKKGSNPKDAEKMVKKHFKYASDKYSKASTAKMAEVIMSLDEEKGK